MKDRRWIGAAVLMLLLCLSHAAAADTISGMVEEATDTGLVLATPEGVRFAVTSEQTQWETDEEVRVGDVVTVHYSGRTDRKMLNADRVICRKISGTVLEVKEGQEAYLLLDDGTEIIRVNMGDIPLRYAAAGMNAVIYTNGMRTRSVPPQLLALYLRGQVKQGTVAEKDGEGRIHLVTDEGETVIVLLSEDTIVLTEPETGKALCVSVLPQMRLSMPAQYEAQDIFPMDDSEEEIK